MVAVVVVRKPPPVSPVAQVFHDSLAMYMRNEDPPWIVT